MESLRLSGEPGGTTNRFVSGNTAVFHGFTANEQFTLIDLTAPAVLAAKERKRPYIGINQAGNCRQYKRIFLGTLAALLSAYRAQI
jgi:hypothetical protein